MRHPFFLVDDRDIYYKILTESITDELGEIYPEARCGYIKTIKDVFKADPIIICGEGSFPKIFLLAIVVLRKQLVLYHVMPGAPFFNRFAKRAEWVVLPRIIEGYDYYPSPVLFSDLATSKHIERIWKRERLASKRGCIGIIGLGLEEEIRQKLTDALNLLIEDLDLNIVFIPILKDEPIKDILSGIKYSANIRYVQTSKYSSKELLGIISKLDILITSDERGVVCAMAVNKPVVGLAVNDELDQFLNGITNEEILFDIDKLKSDELYSKIKIAWVHRDSIAEQTSKKIVELKNKASEGIRRLGKEFIE